MLNRIASIPWNLTKLVIGIGVLVMFAYFGVTILANCLPENTGEVKPPTVSQAQYEIVIENTSLVIYSDKYEMDGQVYILDGFYQLEGNRYKLHTESVSLDPKYFGNIIVRRR